MPSSATEQLRLIGVRCKVVGDGRVIKRRMTAGIRAAAVPLVSSVKQAAGEKLPQSGGLAARVAAERVTVSTLTSGRNAGVRLRQKNHDAYSTNSGTVRHPVFGGANNQRWVQQPIPGAAGWWTDTLRRQSPRVTIAVESIIASVAREVQG